MADIERDDFAEWWEGITFHDDEGHEWSSEEYDYGDREWAVEYLYEHGIDVDDILDHLFDDSEDFWEWFRENYG